MASICRALVASDASRESHGTHVNRYAPCSQVLFEVPRKPTTDGAAAPMAAAHLRNRGGHGVMTPQHEHVIVCKVDGIAGVTRSLDGREEHKRPAPGSFTVVPSGMTIGWQVHGLDETLHLYLSEASVNDFVAQHAELALAPTLEPAFALHDPWLEAFYRLLQAEMHGIDGGLLSLTLFLAEAEHLLLRHLLRRQPTMGRQASRVSPLRPFLLERVRAFVQAHIGSDISLGRLATEVNMSPDHFLRAFAAAVGVTPYRWVNHQRLDAAARLLMQGELGIAEIAGALGYRSASHFAAQFRLRFQATPGQYRLARRSAAHGT